MHNCDYSTCYYCQDYLPRNHKCFIKKFQPKEENFSGVQVFYDFETMKGDDNVQNPYLIMASTCCSICKNIEERPMCSFCRKNHYSGLCLRDLDLRREHKLSVLTSQDCTCNRRVVAFSGGF